MPLPSPRMCGVMLAAIALLALMPRDATAGPLTGNQLPSITMALEDDVRLTWDFRPTIDMFSPAPGGGFQLTSSPTFDVFGGGAQVTIAGLAFDPDPFVLNNILITNTTNNTQSFSAFVGLPTTFGAPNFISGNVLVGVIDGGTDGATLSTTTGFPIYAAQIDFSTVATLLSDPFAITSGAGGTNSASASFGPDLSGIPVNSNIGIQLRFNLSPGDTASILSRFDVVAVPEPATASVLGLSALILLRRRSA